MRIEARAAGLALVDGEGVEVVRGDPLCVGNLTYFFGWLESFGPRVDDLAVALLERPDATAWKACVQADDPELYRGPSVADAADGLPLAGVTYQ